MGTVLGALGAFLSAIAPAVGQLAAKPSFIDQAADVVNKIVLPVLRLFIK